MNKVILTGRLVAEPNYTVTNNQTEVVKFCVAVNRIKDGVDFIDCTAWRKTANFVYCYFHKGDGITLEGRLESQKWEDKNGQKRTSWFVTVDHVEFPLSRREQSTQPAPDVNLIAPTPEQTEQNIQEFFNQINADGTAGEEHPF